MEKLDVEDGAHRRNNHDVVVQDSKEKKGSSGTSTCVKVLIVLLFLAMLACIIALAVVLAQKNKASDDGQQSQQSTTPSGGDKVTDDEDEAPRSATGLYRFGAVAADNKICSNIGTDMLAAKGGSTVDAAIATMLCLGVMNSHSMGIGGGFLLTMYDKSKDEVMALNAREVAPITATEDMYVNKSGASTLGGLAIAVPSEIAGYKTLHDKYGKLPWSDLFQPTIELCEEGFKIPKALGLALTARKPDVMAQSGLADLFLKADGTLMVEGDLLKRTKLAATLRRIAQEGPDTFYTGSLADDVVADIQEEGGIVTKADLAAYQTVWKAPVATKLNHGGYTLYGPPPPSSAAVLYYILNIMDGYKLSKSSRETTEDQILLSHRLVESMKFGYGKRSYLGDEDFVNISEWKSLLQDDTFAEETRQKINDDYVLDYEDYDAAFEIVNDGGTSHLSMIGPDGFAISVTCTINTYLGSKVRGNRTGIIFNNEMDDFSTPGTVNNYGVAASPSNFIRPGKRPMSSMSPTIIMDDNNNLIGVIGASGGTRIITGVLETILNNLWLEYNVTEALDQPRYHHQLLPDEILHEPIWPQEIRDGLAKKGHKFKIRVPEFCVVQFVRMYCQNRSAEDVCMHAGSDARRGGIPDGY